MNTKPNEKMDANNARVVEIGKADLDLMFRELRLPAIRQMWERFAERADTEG